MYVQRCPNPLRNQKWFAALKFEQLIVWQRHEWGIEERPSDHETTVGF